MRIPVVGGIQTRDGTKPKDGKLFNALAEVKKDGTARAVVRPALAQISNTTGNGNGIVCFNGELVNIYDAELNNITYTQSLPVTSPRGIACGNSVVICVGSEFVSPDGYIETDVAAISYNNGLVWSSVILPSSEHWHFVHYLGGRFLAISMFTGVTAVSVDGENWSAGSMPSTGYWRNATYNGTIYCSVQESSPYAATSSDGITWTSRDMPSSEAWKSVAWNGDIFCAVSTGAPYGNVAAISDDGITWTSSVLPASAAWYSICSDGTKFCAVGYNNTHSPNTTLVAISDDGINWELKEPAFNSTQREVIWTGSEFISVSPTYSMKSADGETWTWYAMPNQSLNPVWAFVSNSSNGRILSTTLWYEQTEEEFLSGGIAYSDNDGVSWTVVSVPSITNITTLSNNSRYDFCLIP